MKDPHPFPAAILPHSYPFVLIDRIIELEEEKKAVCEKNVTADEEFFRGHFRDDPVMPGVLIIEAMAQTSGLIIAGGKPIRAYLSAVKEARFIKPVRLGDRIVVTCELIHKFPPLFRFAGVVSVGEETVAEAEIILSLLEEVS